MTEKSYHHGNLREALLQAGLELLKERGASGFSLRACAARAGVSHAAPAHHFGDMRTLLTEIATGGYHALASHLHDARKAAGSDAARAILSAGGAYLAFAKTHSALFGLMADAERIDMENEALQEAVRSLRDELAALAGPASRRTGPAGPHTPALMTRFLNAMLLGIAMEQRSATPKERGPDQDDQAAALLATVAALMLEG